MIEHMLLQQMNDFCRLLRQMDVNVTTTNQLSWCRSVQLIDISERETFYHTARTNLIANRAERETFDMAFNLFWRYPCPEFQVADTGSEELESSALQDLYDADEVANVVPDWSGGTKIGESLLEFYRQFASSFSAYRSVVILISDGWDRGDADLLRRSMECCIGMHINAFGSIH